MPERHSGQPCSEATLALFWSTVIFVGMALTVIGVFLFSLEYTGRDQYVTRKFVALLAMEPVLLVLVGVAVGVGVSVDVTVSVGVGDDG